MLSLNEVLIEYDRLEELIHQEESKPEKEQDKDQLKKWGREWAGIKVQAIDYLLRVNKVNM